MFLSFHSELSPGHNRLDVACPGCSCNAVASVSPALPVHVQAAKTLLLMHDLV